MLGPEQLGCPLLYPPSTEQCRVMQLNLTASTVGAALGTSARFTLGFISSPPRPHILHFKNLDAQGGLLCVHVHVGVGVHRHGGVGEELHWGQGRTGHCTSVQEKSGKIKRHGWRWKPVHFCTWFEQNLRDEKESRWSPGNNSMVFTMFTGSFL